MKRLTYVFAIAAMLLGLTNSVKAQQSWNFTTLSATDQTNLAADKTGNWKKVSDSKTERWGYMAELNAEPVLANGVELTYTKGLKITVSAQTDTSKEGNFRADIKSSRMWIATGSITIPSLTKGQQVTAVYMSSSKDVARGINVTNLTPQSGEFNSTSKGTAQVTSVGIVTEDGDVVLTTTGGMYVYSISVTTPGENPQPEEPAGDDLSVAQSSIKSQAVLTLSDQTKRYYNTADLASIDIDGTNVKVNKGNNSYTFANKVTDISFTKGVPMEEGDEGTYTNPNGKVEISEAKGWLESAYVKFKLFEGATSYNVYVKGGQFTDYTKIDAQLVRNYGTYGRADMVGLTAGDYAMKVVPTNAEGAEMTDAANEATGMVVKNYDRTGYAHFGYSGVGAYNDDGSLKPNAKVLYVTKNTAKTISTTVTGAETNPCVGLQAIITAYEKGKDTTPIAFRFIGLVEKEDLDKIGSSSHGIQVKGKNAYSEMNMTFEGIGDDATVRGFGFMTRNATSVEYRNLAIMRCMDDDVELNTENSHIWIHHNDVFYGEHGSGDHDKGDGCFDIKDDSQYITVSYNHYWDTGKTNMFGMKNESGPNWISYHHNWFDHSDSRHPRVRTMSVHVWNNYFDNVAKYGVGATSGASVFVENNYFLKTKKPILSSNQGTDAMGSGTFSGEDGGMVKAFGNYFDTTCKNFRYFTQKNPSATTGYDAYETATRDEQVPASEVTKAGGNSYNNFDTNSSQIYSYTPDAAGDVPSKVMGYYGAGRLNHGDFSYSFPDNVGDDDADSEYDSTLGGQIDSYKPALVGIFGDESSQGGGEQGGGEQGGGEQGGGEQGGGSEVPEGTITASFNGSSSSSMFTVAGDYGDGSISYNGTSYTKGVKLNSKGSITFTPTKNYNMTMVLATAKDGRDVKINGTATTVSGSENTTGKYYQLQPIAITANTKYVITKGTKESIVMLIILEPVE